MGMKESTSWPLLVAHAGRLSGPLRWFPGSVSMSRLTQNNVQSDQRGFRPETTDSHRSRPLRILFIHRDADTVESCSQELRKAQFAVTADIALNLAQCAEQLHSQSYDVVVAEYPSPSWKGSQGLQSLRQTV